MDYLIKTPAQLGMVLKGRRVSLNLTQKNSGKRVGVLPKTVSAMENLPGRSSIDTLFKLLSALDFELILQPKESVLNDNQKTEW